MSTQRFYFCELCGECCSVASLRAGVSVLAAAVQLMLCIDLHQCVGRLQERACPSCSDWHRHHTMRCLCGNRHRQHRSARANRRWPLLLAR